MSNDICDILCMDVNLTSHLSEYIWKILFFLTLQPNQGCFIKTSLYKRLITSGWRRTTRAFGCDYVRKPLVKYQLTKTEFNVWA
jgi:hypothetical protein